MWQLPFRPAANVNHFFLVNTGKPKETTGEMVDLVKNNYNSNQSEMEQFLLENERQTKNVAVSLKEGNESELIDAIVKGERTLENMGVVSEKAKSFIRTVETNRGAAKILGGEGSLVLLDSFSVITTTQKKLKNSVYL